MIGSLVAAGIAGVFVLRTLLRPVDQLVAGFQAVQAGDLDVRLPAVSDDELGSLSRPFNAMVAGLRERRRIEDMFGKYVTQPVLKAFSSRIICARLTPRLRRVIARMRAFARSRLWGAMPSVPSASSRWPRNLRSRTGATALFCRLTLRRSRFSRKPVTEAITRSPAFSLAT